MIEIKNKLYNSEKRKLNDKQIDKFLSSLEKTRPNEKERILNSEFNLNERALEIKGGFYKFRGVVNVIIPFQKNLIPSVAKGISRLFSENKVSGEIGEIACLDSKCIMDLNPKYKNRIKIKNNLELKKIIDYIDIYSFELSNSSMVYVFTLIFHQKLINYLNKMLIATDKSHLKYKNNGGDFKMKSSFYALEPNMARLKTCEHILLECKIRAYEFLRAYLPIEVYTKHIPLTIDEYYTSFERGSKELDSYYYEENGEYEIDVLQDSSAIKSKAILDLGLNKYSWEKNKFNRSRLLFFLESDKPFHYMELIKLQFVRLVLNSRYLNQFKLTINLKRSILNSSDKRLNWMPYSYKRYTQINKEAIAYKEVLDNQDGHDILEYMKKNPIINSDIDMKYYDKLNDYEHDLDDCILMKFSIKNNHLLLIISIISMAISVLAILITCIFKLIE